MLGKCYKNTMEMLGKCYEIVESISQLSAFSEEVTANTQQATELSNNNVQMLKMNYIFVLKLLPFFG